VRRLLPLPVTEEVDLDAAYWMDDPGSQHVRAMMVSSADGAAQAGGRSAGLSGPADKALFALLRSHADVVLVGAGTARVEDYGGARPSGGRQAWREAHGLSKAPPIAVVTRSAALRLDGRLFTDTLARPIVITQAGVPGRRLRELAEHAEVIVAGEGDVDLAAALDVLAERGLRRVSCEGGPHLLAGVAAAGRLDELCLTVSPLILSGPATRILAGPPLDPPDALQLAQVLEEDGALFLQYLRARAAQSNRARSSS
jgi:riboflavin biosynthesis pyrimidine reductase